MSAITDHDAIDHIGPVRVRCTARDPFAGLRGHDYLRARGLPVKPANPSHTHESLLQAVLRICALPIGRVSA
jgi:hypothetical protein